mgnify:CR=1 FL=1
MVDSQRRLPAAPHIATRLFLSRLERQGVQELSASDWEVVQRLEAGAVSDFVLSREASR